MSKSKKMSNVAKIIKGFLEAIKDHSYVSEETFMEILLSDRIVVENVYTYNLVTKRVLAVFDENRSLVELYVQSICADCTTFSKCKGPQS